MTQNFFSEPFLISSRPVGIDRKNKSGHIFTIGVFVFLMTIFFIFFKNKFVISQQVLVEGSSTQSDVSSPLEYFLVFTGLLIFLIVSWVLADEFAAYLNKKRDKSRVGPLGKVSEQQVCVRVWWWVPACTVLQSTRALYSVILLFILILLHGSFYNGNTLISTTTSSRFDCCQRTIGIIVVQNNYGFALKDKCWADSAMYYRHLVLPPPVRASRNRGQQLPGIK